MQLPLSKSNNFLTVSRYAGKETETSVKFNPKYQKLHDVLP